MRVIAPGGATIQLGEVQAAPTIGISDFSRRVTDDFGITTVAERGFSRQMSVRLAVATTGVDALQQQLAALRATVARWIADDGYAWLDVVGFYKDFSIDFATETVSFCTLTVDGLVESPVLVDGGADPAPGDRVSTLRLIQPVAITDAVLVSSSVPENDHPQWSASIAYAQGARVLRGSAHRIYESAVSSNIGHDPAAATGEWIDAGPTNRWAMFDQALGSATTASDTITVVLPAGAIDAVALLDVKAAQVRVQAQRAQAPHYDQTLAVTAGSTIFPDVLGVPGGNPITVTISGSGAIEVGTLLAGHTVGLGLTEAAPTAGITDFSKKEVDDFGNATLVPRAWAKKMSANALIRSDAVDLVAYRIAAVRSRPALWIGDGSLDSLIVYGFFRSFSIEIGASVSKLALEIEGLSAAPKVKPITGESAPLLLTEWSVDGATGWHVGYVEGVDFYYRQSNDDGATWGPAIKGAARDGVSAYAILLTNEQHILPADAAGNIISYAGASTDVAIYAAGADVTSSFALSVVDNPQALSLTLSGAKATVTGGLDASEPNAVVTLRMTGSGAYAGVVLDKVFGLTKSRAGADAEPPVLIALDATAQTVRYDTAGAFIPGQSITFTASRQNTNEPTVFRFVNWEGAELYAASASDFVASSPAYYTSTGPDSLTITPVGLVDNMTHNGGAAGRFSIGARVVVDGETFADTVSVQKVRDGARGDSAYSIILSNETHQVPATVSGEVISYAGAAFSVKILYGSTDVTGSFALTGNSNPQNLLFGDSVFPNYQVTGGFDPGEDAATFTGVYSGSGAHAGVVLTKTFSLTKSKAAADGVSPPLLTLSASSLTARFNAAGQLTTGAITFTVERTNASGAPIYRFEARDGDGHAQGTAAALVASSPSVFSSAGPDNLTIAAGFVESLVNHAGQGFVRVRAWVGSGSPSDTVSIVKVQDGADGEDGKDGQSAVAAYITNPADQVPADVDGNVISYDGLTGGLRIFYGAADVTDSGEWSALTSHDNPQGLTASINGRSFAITGGFDRVEDSARIVFKAIGLPNTRFAGQTVYGTYSLTKARAAVNGENPPLIRVASTLVAVRTVTDGSVAANQTARISAQRFNTSAPTRWTVRDRNGNAIGGTSSAQAFVDTWPQWYQSPDPDTLVMTTAGLAAHVVPNGLVYVEVQIGDGAVAYDRVGIGVVKDGQPGQSALALTASPATVDFPADYQGNLSIAPGDRSIKFTLRAGETDVSGSTIWTIDSATGCTPTIDGTGRATFSAVSSVGGSFRVKAVYAGKELTQDATVTVSKAAAPPSTNTSVSQSVGAIISSLSYSADPMPKTALLTVGPSGSVTFGGSVLGFIYAGGSTLASWNGEFKMVYRVPGNAWQDAAAPKIFDNGAVRRGGAEPENDPAFSRFSGLSLSGLQAGTVYEFGVNVRKYQGSNGSSVDLGGTLTVSTS